MIIKNVIVYTEDKKFTAGGIVIHDDKIDNIYTTENVPDMIGEEGIDGRGAYAIPGLIDLHFHGCMGDDFCDNIGNLAQVDVVSVGGVLLCELALDGAGLCADLVLRVVCVVKGLDLICVGLGGDKALTAFVVDLGEVHEVCTVGVGRVACHAEVALLCAELCESAVKVHGDYLKLEAELVGDVLCKCDIKTNEGRIAVFTDRVELVRSEVGAGGNGQLAFFNCCEFSLELVKSHG